VGQKSLLIFIVLLVSFHGYGFAQVKGVEYDVKVDVESVFLNLSVRERATDRFLAGLQKNDFLIFEDGVQQDIQQFLPVEAPFSLLLLLDVSGSTGSYLNLMKQAAIEFTHQISTDDRIAVATFNSKVKLIQDFTSDRSEAERAIKHIKSGGGTAFYDALMTCINQYMNGIQGRSAIVVFTDGVDNRLEGLPESGSRIGFGDLFRRIQEIDTIVYTIFLNTEEKIVLDFPDIISESSGRPGRRSSGGSPGSFTSPHPSASPYPHSPKAPADGGDAVYRQAREQLKLITDQTGGRMYLPEKIDQLSGAYSQVAGELRIQYQLGYNSTNPVHDGRWRKIRVEVDNNPEAMIRTRRGYYAAR
jgi:Ca-activated chloride channel family protein